MGRFLKFVFVGLIFGIAAEVVNQLYVNNSPQGFLRAILAYAVYVPVLFILKKVFNRILTDKFSNVLLWYALLGVIGLFGVEWALLGNAGVAWYGQIAMFTFWGSFGLLPTIFSEEPSFPELRSGISKFSLFWIPAYIIAGIPDPGLGLIIWIFGTIFLNYFYFKYFRAMRSFKPEMEGQEMP